MKFFTNTWVGFVENPTGRRFIQMELRNGYQHFRSDVQPNKRGLKKCEHIAAKLGLELYVTPEARSTLEASK